MLGRQGVWFDLALAAVGCCALSPYMLWNWPGDEWFGWPIIAAFAVSYALARLLGGLYAGWPKPRGPESDEPDHDNDPDQSPDRPLTLPELAALGLGAAALLAVGWSMSPLPAIRF